MTDKELLELAAKAAGYKVTYWPQQSKFGFTHAKDGGFWNPLEDDGDALRLAVKLIFLIATDHRCAVPTVLFRNDPNDWSDGELDDDPYTATRRAIVKAAAGIANTLR